MKEQVKDFLNNNLTEAEYYSLPKENLLTLKEYILQLREKDNEFENYIEPYFDSIKKECPWVKEIGFDGVQDSDGKYLISTIYLYATDEINLIVKFNPKSFRYEDIACKIPYIYLLSKKTRTRIKRQKELDLIQNELYQIELVARKIYNGVLSSKSISNNFKIEHSPNFATYVLNENDIICRYGYDEKKHYDRELLADKQKEQLLTKVLVKKQVLIK